MSQNWLPCTDSDSFWVLNVRPPSRDVASHTPLLGPLAVNLAQHTYTLPA